MKKKIFKPRIRPKTTYIWPLLIPKLFLLKKRINYYIQYFNNLHKLVLLVSKFWKFTRVNNKNSLINIKYLYLLNTIFFKNQYNLDKLTLDTKFIKVLLKTKFFYIFKNKLDYDNLLCIYFNKLIIENVNYTYKNYTTAKLLSYDHSHKTTIKLLMLCYLNIFKKIKTTYTI